MKLSYECKKFCLVFLAGILIFSLSACSKAVVRNHSQPAGYPIAADVQTTRSREQSRRAQHLRRRLIFGRFPNTANTAMETGLMAQVFPTTSGSISCRLHITSSAVTKKTKLLNFFTISDIHITDKESP
jgi:hypothetical protein